MLLHHQQIALQRPDLMAGVRLFEMDYDSLFAIPIVVFGFNCHAMVVSIFQELEVGGLVGRLGGGEEGEAGGMAGGEEGCEGRCPPHLGCGTASAACR